MKVNLGFSISDYAHVVTHVPVAGDHNDKPRLRYDGRCRYLCHFILLAEAALPPRTVDVSLGLR